jgi:hypothetical protein
MRVIMIFGTVISAVLAFLLVLYPYPITTNWNGLALMTIFISFGFFCLFLYLRLAAWIPLQTEEKSFSPRVFELFRKDVLMRLINPSLELLPLISIFLGVLLYVMEASDKIKIICLWIFLLGVQFDLLRHLLGRIQNFFNPYGVVSMMTKAAKSSIQNDREMELCDWIDSIAEIAVKAIPRSSTSLANDAVNELQVISKIFLESSKSIGYENQDAQSKKMGITDKISFTLFYLFQRLELINDKAIQYKLEPICSNIITTLGKIILNSAKCDISLTNFPIHYLGKFALRAQQNQLEEVGIKASLTLFEVAKTLLDVIDPTYFVIKDAYFSLITQMHEIAKETFKQDKNTRIDLLTQPFRDLKERFKTEKMVNHPDTPEIISKIDNVLAEFDALELILRTIPPLPQFPEETPAAPASP